jgi:hypothetical protein
MNIVGVFAGRRANIDILSRYLKDAVKSKLIDEVHFWNITRNVDDEEYLKTICNLRRTSSTSNKYVEIHPRLQNNTFSLTVCASRNLCIQLSGSAVYEICLGCLENTTSTILENGRMVAFVATPNVLTASGKTFNFSLNKTELLVSTEDDTILRCRVDGFILKKIEVKSNGSVASLKYTEVKNHGFFFMDTCIKSWQNFYEYYDTAEYRDAVIMKCDDDIVFMDLNKMSNFVAFTRANEYDLVFANTINNGVSAFYQQNKFDLIPKELMLLEYPNEGLCGTLWESGTKAQALHTYFTENYNLFLAKEYVGDVIPLHSRYSINFFAAKGSNWSRIADCYDDDEYNLTVKYRETKQFKNVLYADFYVAHLSFHRQIETGINLDAARFQYLKLYYIQEYKRIAREKKKNKVV